MTETDAHRIRHQKASHLPDDLRELHGQPVADDDQPDAAEVLGLRKEAEGVQHAHLLLRLLLGELPLLASPFCRALQSIICFVPFRFVCLAPIGAHEFRERVPSSQT